FTDELTPVLLQLALDGLMARFLALASSESIIPFPSRIFFSHQRADLLRGNLCEKFSRLPGFPQSVFDGGALDVEVAQKVFVRAVLAIRRLALWQAKKSFHQSDVEVHEKRAVKEQRISVPALSIAGEFQVLQSEIGVTLDFDWPS